jgi:hypothetical protein
LLALEPDSDESLIQRPKDSRSSEHDFSALDPTLHSSRARAPLRVVRPRDVQGRQNKERKIEPQEKNGENGGLESMSGHEENSEKFNTEITQPLKSFFEALLKHFFREY